MKYGDSVGGSTGASRPGGAPPASVATDSGHQRSNIFQQIRSGTRRFLFVTLTALLLAVGLATGPAAAAPGGHGNGNGSGNAHGQGSATPASYNGLALTPPMGFNDWNAYKCNVSAALIEQTAQYMVSSGMKDAGYQYVNIDDCWLSGARDANGNLVPDPVKFPDGIKAVADYVHGLGLKLGIYEDAGTTTCAGYPGSLGHEQQDADTFASWGVDYLKYDQCNIPFANYPNMTHQQIDTMLYTTMSKALAASGRPIVFSMCNGTDSTAYPWLWGAPVSNLWRTTTDIQDNFASMLSLVTQNSALQQYAHPGAWNDPDMLEIGNGGMSTTEYQSEFSLWSEMAAPLISGTTLTTASPTTMSIYLNKDVIAVDQDSLGVQGRLLTSAGGDYVFAKPLSNGDVAVALFNSNGSARTISTTATAVGLKNAGVYGLDDLWSKQQTETAGTISAFVPAHGTVMYRVSAPHNPVSTLLEAPSVVAAVTSSANPVTTGSTATVTVSVTDNGRTPVAGTAPTLSVPSGWSATAVGHPRPWALRTGQSESVQFAVRAPSTAAPLSTADLVGSVHYLGVGGLATASPDLTVELVSPVTAPLASTDQSGGGAVFGESGQQLAISAAGLGVSPQRTTTRGTTPASDQYATIYQPGGADQNATAQVTLTAHPGAGRSAQAGLTMRNSAAGSPAGVVLYVNGSGGVVMSWNATGGAVVDTSSTTSAAQTLPVQLRLVRNGSSYTGYYSTNGTTWTQVATATVAASASAATQDVGVYQASGTAGAPAEADFTGFTVTG